MDPQSSAEPSAEASGPPELEPLPVHLPRLVTIGTALWAVALVLALVVPAWHRGERDWWPWAALSGVLLGLIGLAYLKRGRGNIADL